MCERTVPTCACKVNISSCLGNDIALLFLGFNQAPYAVHLGAGASVTFTLLLAYTTRVQGTQQEVNSKAITRNQVQKV